MTVDYKNIQKKMVFFAKCMLVFGIIYNHTIMSFSSVFSSERIAVFVLMAIIIMSGKIIIKKDYPYKYIKNMLLFQSFLFVYTLMLIAIIGKGEGTNILGSIGNYLIMVPLEYIGLTYIFHDRDEFMHAILVVTLFQCIIILGGMLNDDIRYFVDEIYNQNEYFDYSLYRTKGYPGGIACITSTGSLQISMGIIACLHFIQNKAKNIKYMICFAFISVMMTAVSRTGLVIAIVGAVLIFRESLYIPSKKLGKLVLTTCAGMFIACIGILVFDIGDFITDMFRRVLKGNIGAFFNAYFNADTTIIPGLSFKTMIGTGILSGTSGNGVSVNADGGFVRTYVALGLPLCMIFYYGIIILFKKIISYTKDKSIKAVLLCCCLIFWIGEFKEPFFYTRYLQVIMFVYLYLAVKGKGTSIEEEYDNKK